MKRIAILTAIHNRPEITDIFIERTKRAIRRANTVNEYLFCAVASNDIVTPKLKDYSLELITYTQNKPLGRKWNLGMQDVGNYISPDYVIILGSDDLISHSFLELVDHKINQGYELISFNDLYFYNLNRRRIKFNVCGYWAGRRKGFALGVGRVCGRRILDAINWAPWGETKDSGLDGSFVKRTKEFWNPTTTTLLFLKEHGAYCMDIKTEGNISGIGNFDIEEIDPRKLMSRFMDDDEIERVFEYKMKL